MRNSKILNSPNVGSYVACGFQNYVADLGEDFWIFWGKTPQKPSSEILDTFWPRRKKHVFKAKRQQFFDYVLQQALATTTTRPS